MLAQLDFVLERSRGDERPYLNVSVLGVKVMGLLDSGANRTCVGSPGISLLQKLGLVMDHSRVLSCRVADGNQCRVEGIF